AAFLKLMESDEVPGARLEARFRGRRCETTTDREGYFRAGLATREAKPGWNAVEVGLAGDPATRAQAEVLVPSPRARFGVVSDLDDTVIQSNVLHKVRMVVSLALS